MAILMQGSWTISVKSKNASFPQRFIVAGASVGNGTYAGDTSTPAVFVNGSHWSIRVQNNPGSGWIDSEDQITTPTSSGGLYRFDVQTNDAGGDQDFNDLILTASTPVTATDFLLYGNARSYRGVCIFNPCYPRFAVVDSFLGLKELQRYPALRDILNTVYPERLKPQPPNPPDPPPFVPMVLSLDDDTPIPVKKQMTVRLKDVPRLETKAAAAEFRQAIQATEFQPLSQSRYAAATFDKVGLASFADRIKLNCQTNTLAGVAIRFLEYDRTALELTGGPYTGTGGRETLGTTVTDRNGNYVFRFQRSIGDFFGEAASDTGSGESSLTQSAPDIIAQVIDVMAPSTVLWESAPYFNIPNFKRINICVPEDRLHPSLCIQGQVIQAIGNVFIGQAIDSQPAGEPKGFGRRVGYSNSLGLSGRITSRNVSGPQTRCAAWSGTLDLFGCFLDHPAVTHYTLRYRRLYSGTDWTFFSQELRHPLISKVGQVGYSGELIGPHSVSLQVDGGAAALTPAYHNIESNTLYVSTHRDRRAQIRSWLLSVAMPGAVQFWVEGYNASGQRIAGAEDSVTLHIDNEAPFLDVYDTVSMLGQPQGNCAKFKLPAGQPAAPLTVRFKADEAQGFLDSYELYVQKGATGTFNVTPPPPTTSPFRLQSYVHVDDLVCTSFRGTFNDPAHELLTGFVTVNLSPQSGGWLDTGQTFCAFSINLSATTRVTNGYGGGTTYSAVPVLIGIEA